MREGGKRNSEEDAGVFRRSRRMSSYQESPAAKVYRQFFPDCHFRRYRGQWRKKEKGNVENVVPHLSSKSTDNNKKATKKGFSCNMYNWAFREKKTSQCFSLFIGQINFLGHLSYLRAGNCALKILANRLEDGHIHWSKKNQSCRECYVNVFFYVSCSSRSSSWEVYLENVLIKQKVRSESVFLERRRPCKPAQIQEWGAG